jgi:two-component system, chemotaxis family, chemotaxis protein CheY
MKRDHSMNRTILVVDDSATIRQMLTCTLQEAGFEVLQGNNGQDGLDRLEANNVDLIISDLNMPVMDGYTFIRHVRGRADRRTTPIIVLTTESSVEKKTTGREAGASGWIVKPFSPEKLLQAIGKLLA